MKWKGVIPAMTTGFKPGMSVDHIAVAKHAQWLVIAMPFQNCFDLCICNLAWATSSAVHDTTPNDPGGIARTSAARRSAAVQTRVLATRRARVLARAGSGRRERRAILSVRAIPPVLWPASRPVRICQNQ